MSNQKINDPSFGYAPQWQDTVEYIEDITYRIWEKGNIDYIDETYSKNCPIFTLQSCCFGSDVVITNTKRTIEVFPDRTLYPEAILWNGDNGDGKNDDPDDHGNVDGYHSSHLINSKMTYSHPVISGEKSLIPYTSDGRWARIWVIAHCIIRNGIIIREWLVRDNLSLFKQLDLCPNEVAKTWANDWLKELKKSTEDGNSQYCHYKWLKSEFDRVTSLQQKQNLNNLDIDLQNIFPLSHREKFRNLGQYFAFKYAEIWGKNGMSTKEKFHESIKSIYHPHARHESPLGNEVLGHGDLVDLYEVFVLGNNLGEDIAFTIDWVIICPHEKAMWSQNKSFSRKIQSQSAWRYPCPSDFDNWTNVIKDEGSGENITDEYSIAIRWTLVGKQKQINSYGDRLNSLPVVLMAESHLRCVGVRIIHDITVYDSVALQAQIEFGKQLEI